MFTILKKSKKSNARIGKLRLPNGEIITPCFLPIATRGAVKNLTPEELKELDAQIILANTYHLIQRPGLRIIKKAGGLHNFISWDGPILTDSGGYQIFSLARKRKITKNGVKFISEIDGKKIFLTPEKSIEAQIIFGSDIIMVLDECPPWPATHKYAKKSLNLTIDWAKKAKIFYEKRLGSKTKNKAKPLIFGISQGSTFKDLREKSVKGLVEIGFDGYAVGGVSVGEPAKDKKKVLEWMAELLPEEKPRYVMGYGKPEEIVEAVNLGMDIFDCVIPTREARHGRIYKYKSKIQNPKSKITSKNPNFYEVIQIDKAKFRNDLKPIDKYCKCYTCKNYSRTYLNHLFRTKEPLALRLATIHNLYFYLSLMKKLHDSIY